MASSGIYPITLPYKSDPYRHDPGRGTVGPDPQNIGFLSNTGPDPLKNHKASIQCWAIIGTPAKRHLNGVSLACQ